MFFASHGPLALLIAQILVIVAVSRGLALGARALGQPAVIAQIAAGIALGPSLLGSWFPELSAALFPAASLPSLSLVAQLGVLLFLFLVGLNFEVGLLAERGRTAVIISNASVAAPFALGFGLATYLFPGLSPPGVSFAAFALFMGVAMSITALPVLASILVEKKLSHTPLGTLALTCAAADDVTGWCILAFVVAFARAGAPSAALFTAALAVAYGLAMVGPVRRRLQAWAEQHAGSGEASLGTATAALFFAMISAWTTEMIGIHALFGAFLAGCIIPKTGGLASSIARRIETLVVVLLLPLFFAYSGLRTRVALLDSVGDWAVCALILAAAVAGKFGGSAVAARLSGMPARESVAIGVLMNTRGLMELVVLNVGLDLGVVSEKLFAMMVVMALVTTFATAPLLDWWYPHGTADTDTNAPLTRGEAAR